MTPPTGRVWLAHLAKHTRDMRRTEPDRYEALMWLRDEVLDAVTRGEIDLSLPLAFERHDDGSLTFRNITTTKEPA